jgi:GNAT superfamily N-acetyltransferase
VSWVFVDFDSKYDHSKFDCGEPILNDYLRKQMSQDFKRKANVPLLAVNTSNEIIGFYTLSSCSVEFRRFPEKLKKKIAPYPVPVARIGRLAVDQSIQGKGLGKELLFHSIDRVEELSKKLGLRAIVVDAKNLAAETFYKKYGFELLHTATNGRSLLFLIV